MDNSKVIITLRNEIKSRKTHEILVYLGMPVENVKNEFYIVMCPVFRDGLRVSIDPVYYK